MLQLAKNNADVDVYLIMIMLQAYTTAATTSINIGATANLILLARFDLDSISTATQPSMPQESFCSLLNIQKPISKVS